MLSLSKVKGKKKAINALIDYVVLLEENIKDHRVIIGHADALDLAEKCGELLKEKFGDDLKIEYDVVNPTAGSHCGPDSIGICFHAKHR